MSEVGVRDTSWTAVVLAGGLGTRLQKVCPDTPKPLVPVLGRPFLEWVLEYLKACSVGRVVISTGYRGEQFGAYNGEGIIPGLCLSTVQELEPLGTAGGFLHALKEVKSCDNIVVVNGDSLVLVPLKAILEDFLKDSADAAIIAIQVEDASRYGTLDIGDSGCVQGFREKQRGPAMVNAGIYLFHKSTVASFPEKRPLSFESEAFPHLIASRHRIRSYQCKAPFLDIGIPESLAQAETFVSAHFNAFLREVKT